MMVFILLLILSLTFIPVFIAFSFAVITNPQLHTSDIGRLLTLLFFSGLMLLFAALVFSVLPYLTYLMYREIFEKETLVTIFSTRIMYDKKAGTESYAENLTINWEDIRSVILSYHWRSLYKITIESSSRVINTELYLRSYKNFKKLLITSLMIYGKADLLTMKKIKPKRVVNDLMDRHSLHNDIGII